MGNTHTVKVTYTNKCTQNFKIKTKKKKMPSYAKKIVNELKPLLANPDNGLKTAMTWWEKPSNDKYENEFLVKNFNNEKTVSTLSMDDVMRTYTSSQKQALILELYFRTRMTYGLAGHNRTESYCYHRNSNALFKLLYQGKFWGLCEEGTAMAYDVCQCLGVKANYAGSNDLNHAWCGIWVTDKNGTSYWHGIYTSAYSYNLKASVPHNDRKLTKAQVNKYLCQPNNQTQIVVSAKRKNTGPRPVVTPPSVATQAPVQTPAPQVTPQPTPVPEPTPTPTETPKPQRILIPHDEHGYTCPGCNPLNPPPVRHTSKTNPYITNIKATYKDYVVYQHIVGTTARWFDADGNEYIDLNNDGNIMNELITLAG